MLSLEKYNITKIKYVLNIENLLKLYPLLFFDFVVKSERSVEVEIANK